MAGAFNRKSRVNRGAAWCGRWHDHGGVVELRPVQLRGDYWCSAGSGGALERGRVPAAAGPPGGDPQARGRRTAPRGASGAGSADPAGDSPGPDVPIFDPDFCPNVASGSRPGAAARTRRVQIARWAIEDGHRWDWWILIWTGSSTGCSTDALMARVARKVGRRPSGAQASSAGSLEAGIKWTAGSLSKRQGGGDPAGLPPLADFVEHHARRPGPGAVAARSAVRALRRRCSHTSSKAQQAGRAQGARRTRSPR